MLDRDIRPILKQTITSSVADSVIFDEMPLCRSARADVTAVNCSLRGYEIKSSNDTLNRLPLQIPFYDQVFDYSVAVVAEKHLKYARRILPRHWGIMRAVGSAESLVIEHVRAGTQNNKVQVEALIFLLWKQEAVKVGRTLGLPLKGNMPVRQIWGQLAKVPRRTIAPAIRDAIKARGVPAVASQQTSDGDSFPTEPIAEAHQYQRCLERLR